MAGLPWWVLVLLGILIGWVLHWLLELLYWRRRRAGADIDLESDYQASLVAKDEEFSRVRQDYDARLTTAQDDLALASDARAQLEAALKSKDDDLIALNRQLAGLQKELDGLKDADGSRAKEIAVLTAGAATAAAALKSKDSDLDAAKARVAELEAQLAAHDADAGKANADADARLKAKDAELAGLSNHLARLEADLKRAQDDGGSRVAEIAKLTAAAAATAAVIKAKDNEADAAKARAAELEAQLAAREADAGKVSTDASAQLKAKDAELAELSNRLARLEADLKRAQDDGGSRVAEIAKLTAAAAATAAVIKAKDNEADAAKARAAELEAQLKAGTEAEAKLKARDAELAEVNARLSALQAELKKAQDDGGSKAAEVAKLAAAAAATAAVIKAKDGEVEASQARLAKIDSEAATLREAQTTLQAELDGWTLNKLAAMNVAGATALAARPAARTSACPQDLAEVAGISTVFEQRLYRAGIGTFWELAHLSDAALVRILEVEDQRLNNVDPKAMRADAARLALETGTEGHTWSGEEPDDFEPLEGIGPVYERKLYDAGICTYAALAGATVEQLSAICPPSALQKPNHAAWIAQARALTGPKRQSLAFRQAEQQGIAVRLAACPQDLADVAGISTVFEQRLYNRGIGTFWELAHMSDEELKAALQLRDKKQPAVDLARIRADALRLAGETKTQGRIWSGGKADDFEPLEGIGPVYEKRLYEAGICTYEALAALTVQQLEAIVADVNAVKRPNFARWIEQAKSLGGRK